MSHAAPTPIIVIVDDDEGLRHSLSYLLASVSLHCEHFADAKSFFAAYPNGIANRPGCILLDVRMPVMGGLEMQQQLARTDNLLPIIIMTGHGDIPMAVNALKNGALDFIEKPFKDQPLIDAILKAIDTSRKRLSEQLRNSDLKTRLERLTSRERTVLKMVLQGKVSKEIAFTLSISPKTVEVHRHSIMSKMEAKSVAELACLALAAVPELLSEQDEI